MIVAVAHAPYAEEEIVTTPGPTGHPGGATAPVPVIELVHPMPGFPVERRFTLVQLDDDGTLCALKSLDREGLEFLVVPPGSFYPAYEPVIDDEIVADLGIERVDDVLVLGIVHAGQDLASTTINLRAPLVVNIATRRAAQVVLEDVELSVTAPLVA